MERRARFGKAAPRIFRGQRPYYVMVRCTATDPGSGYSSVSPESHQTRVAATVTRQPTEWIVPAGAVP